MKILYIVGMGRSGSSLLAKVLGQHEGVVDVGELRNLWEFGVRLREPCSCGETISTCPRWQPVFRKTFGAGLLAPGALSRAKADFDRLRSMLALRRFEHVDADYRSATARLLGAIADVTGARVIVDASKSPPFGYFLEHVLGADVSYIHLIRDARGVAYSSNRVRAHGQSGRRLRRAAAVRTSVRWVALNMASERLVRRSAGRHLRLRYEEFATQPRKVVERVLACVGESPRLASAWEIDAEGHPRLWLEDHHSIGGNPAVSRSAAGGGLTIRPDLTWRSQGSAATNALVATLTWPLLWRYGYLARDLERET